MKSVLLFDTSIASLNIGDEIINVSIKKNWPEIFSDNYIMTFPTHTPSFHLWQNILMKKNKIYADADYKFLCGTNILYTNMLRPEPAWNIFLGNISIAKNTVCVGAGIGVNSSKITGYTKHLFKTILSNKYIHSVRDSKTKKYLESLGLKAWNTGCPTLWGLTPEFCVQIPAVKADKVVFTLTSYQTDQEKDQSMIDILKKNYRYLYFWPQSFADFNYFSTLSNINNIEVVAPNLQAYDKLLLENIDYVGNRLHGGIYAMQHKCRTIIIAIDYRAEEMSKNYSFVCIKRNEITEKLDDLIKTKWKTAIEGLDFNQIAEWKRQFKDER